MPRWLGTARKIDGLGRIVIPADIRRRLHIDTTTQLEMHIDGDNLVLMKVQPQCAICGSPHKLAKQIDDKFVCVRCTQILVEHVNMRPPSTATPRPRIRSSGPAPAKRTRRPEDGVR